MKIIEVSSSFTRPADTTAYAQGDLVANSTTAGSVTPLTFKIPYGRGLKVHRVNITRSDATVTNAKFKVHFFKDSPTVANGDNGALSATVSGYLGTISVDGSGQAFSDDGSAFGVYVNNSVFAPMVCLADVDQKIYGLVSADAAYTPTSGGTFTVSIIGEAYV